MVVYTVVFCGEVRTTLIVMNSLSDPEPKIVTIGSLESDQKLHVHISQDHWLLYSYAECLVVYGYVPL